MSYIVFYPLPFISGRLFSKRCSALGTHGMCKLLMQKVRFLRESSQVLPLLAHEYNVIKYFSFLGMHGRK